ncbi:uncharacterized protein EV420DRAFT_1484863 [Desarmillaria tabescens]|uniref:Uncharacterized protein n=1 Tax=Armillaria tabescens TaxID=1929756 RepID=A0AA39JMD5_ARMTA|nr:uncharacterized protein EV420DRAFT_1484863 [Desarmillaria tabescens]KAK0443994.1 hypothetical protein EV420DRAFT_1484863 [Desarmillaria tabescens]
MSSQPQGGRGMDQIHGIFWECLFAILELIGSTREDDLIVRSRSVLHRTSSRIQVALYLSGLHEDGKGYIHQRKGDTSGKARDKAGEIPIRIRDSDVTQSWGRICHDVVGIDSLVTEQDKVFPGSGSLPSICALFRDIHHSNPNIRQQHEKDEETCTDRCKRNFRLFLALVLLMNSGTLSAPFARTRKLRASDKDPSRTRNLNHRNSRL